MRVIKFRGRDIITQEWRYGAYSGRKEQDHCTERHVIWVYESRLSKELGVYEFTDMPPRYDREVSSLLVGNEPPGVESIVEKRIPLDVEAGNKAFSLRALEAVYLSRLKGAQAPNKQRFLALTLELTNILPEQDVVI